MTREEAIRIFRREIECLSHAKCEDCILEKVCDPAKTTPFDSEYIEAYGMAIQALEQEPCTDAVSREAVLNIASLHTLTVNESVEAIKKLPSVNPQPCDDAVSRQLVLEAVSEGCQEWRGIYGSCEELINELPSVTPTCEEREKGECPYYAG